MRGPLQLKSERAEELGLAKYVVADFDELKKLYNLEGDLCWPNRVGRIP